MLLGGSAAYSQENRSEIFVDFRVNSTQIDSGYKENADRISELISFCVRFRRTRPSISSMYPFAVPHRPKEVINSTGCWQGNAWNPLKSSYAARWNYPTV